MFRSIVYIYLKSHLPFLVLELIGSFPGYLSKFNTLPYRESQSIFIVVTECFFQNRKRPPLRPQRYKRQKMEQLHRKEKEDDARRNLRTQKKQVNRLKMGQSRSQRVNGLVMHQSPRRSVVLVVSARIFHLCRQGLIPAICSCLIIISPRM